MTGDLGAEQQAQADYRLVVEAAPVNAIAGAYREWFAPDAYDVAIARARELADRVDFQLVAVLTAERLEIAKFVATWLYRPRPSMLSPRGVPK
jgi:hypothetical protein